MLCILAMDDLRGATSVRLTVSVVAFLAPGIEGLVAKWRIVNDDRGGEFPSGIRVMNQKSLIVAAVLTAWASPAVRCIAQAIQAPQAPITKREAEPPRRILEKNAEFRRLLDPPAGDEFLQIYSQGYQDKAIEIENKVAPISDEKLRDQARSDEWASVPKKDLIRFKSEADVAYYQAKVSYLKSHKDSWFEVGQVKYDDVINALLVKTLPGAVVQANLRMAISRDRMNEINEKFRKIADADIDEKTRTFVSKASPGSMCASKPEWCYSVKRDEVEQSVRTARMIVVGQGDLQTRKIERLLLVDYETEIMLQEFDPHLSAADSLVWRFSAGVPPLIAPEPPMPAAQPQETTAAVVQETPPASLNPQTNENSPESKVNSTSTLFPAAINVRRPVKVTPAAALEQPPAKYPDEARSKNIQGEVLLHATIGKEGRITEVHVLSGDNSLAPSAVEAVRRWRYTPMLVDGQPTEVETTITITFSLND